MRDRELLAWLTAVGCLVCAGVASASLALAGPTSQVKIVHREHPVGLRRIASLDEETRMGALTRSCQVWANFRPDAATSFLPGQRYVSECRVLASAEGSR